MKTQMSSILTVLALVLGAQATTTHYVVPPGTPGASPSGDFTSWATAATNIADAVGIATNNSLVLVSAGHYLLTNQIEITSAITLRSDNNGVLDAEGTILDAQYPAFTNRCIHINNVAAVVEGVTLTNGFAAATDVDGKGGGAYVNLRGTLRGCIVAGNRAESAGGGAYLYYGGLLDGCTFVGNQALTNSLPSSGGGAFISAPGTWVSVATNCVFRGNSARFGAGVTAQNSTISAGGSRVVDCDIIGNTLYTLVSGEGGAGVYLQNRAFVDNCRVISNQVVKINGSPYGAGILMGIGAEVHNSEIGWNTGATYGGAINVGSLVTNCVIHNNSSSYGGGGSFGENSVMVDSIVVSNSSAAFLNGGTIRNSLIAYNDQGIRDFNTPGGHFQNCTVTQNGYGFSFGYDINAPTSIVENCIVYDNGPAGQDNYSIGPSAVLILTNSCTTPLPGGPDDSGNTDDAPRFVDAVNGDFNLRGSSPCVNAGVFRDWMTGAFDLQGERRILGDTVDMGAFEYLPLGTLMQVR